MKTAISIPNEVFEAAERTAKRLGVSRSELYANAVRDYLENKKNDDVTAQLNRVYADKQSSPDQHLQYLQQLQFASLDREDW